MRDSVKRILLLGGARTDPDALAFAAASGATDVAALSAFAKGVKALGLWSNMVCWPLRSSQNAGSGTTAYSFGGLGTYNGTLVNGPTWGTAGIAFVGASSQVMTTGYAWGSSETTSIAAAVITPSAQANKYLFGSATPRFASFFTATGVLQAFTQNTTFQPAVSAANELVAGSPSWIACITTSQAYRAGQINGGAVFSSSTGSGAGTYVANVSIMAADAVGSSAATGTMPFFAAFKAGSLAEMEQVRSLYKLTLGQGLGLP